MDYILIDGFLPQEELNKTMKEIDFLHGKMHTIENDEETAKAVSATGKRVWLEEVYKDQYYSDILRYKNDFIKGDTFISYIIKHSPCMRQFLDVNWSSSLLSYYENTNHYKTHYDKSLFTMLMWFYKEPKEFTGGELILPEVGETFDCINNRMIMFPSWYYHEVKPVKVNKPGMGRYTITHFFNIRP